MGTWSSDPFGNDTALDWAFSLEEVDDLSLIEETIQKVLDTGDEYLEATVAEEAIVAADTVARLKGKFYTRDAATQPIDGWVTKHRLKPSPELVKSCLTALDRILTDPSELKDLWSEGDDFEEWRSQILALKIRLR